MLQSFKNIVENMEYYSDKLNLYDKKRARMGLNQEEGLKYYTYLGRYLQWKYRLFDSVFDKYITPRILKDEAEELYYEMFDLIGWQLELLIDDKDMTKMKEEMDKVKDQEYLRKLLVDLYIKLMVNLERFLKKLPADELLKGLSLLYSDGKSESFEYIKDQLEYKFEIMYVLLEGDEEYEEIKKDSK